MIFACQNTSQNGIQALPEEQYLAVCTTHGQWEPDPYVFCSSKYFKRNDIDINYGNTLLTLIST